MNPYDKEKTREIWKRVLSDEEPAECHAMDSEQLRKMIEIEKTDACIYRMLARCASGSNADCLRRMAQEEAGHARKLEALFYLWTGKRACAVSGTLPRFRSLAEALRLRHPMELTGAEKYREAAAQLPEFQDLFLRLSEEEARHAAQVLCMLQHYV